MNTITINSNELSKAIQNIIGVVERKQTMPILSHILIECKKGLLTFTSTDLEVQLSTVVEANNERSAALFALFALVRLKQHEKQVGGEE